MAITANTCYNSHTPISLGVSYVFCANQHTSGSLMKMQFRFFGSNPEPILDRLPTSRVVKKEDEKFIESQGRLLFLCFLKPIINGTGFYYVEPQTRTSNRMDIVVTYLEEEFIIECLYCGIEYETLEDEFVKVVSARYPEIKNYPANESSVSMRKELSALIFPCCITGSHC